MIKADFIVIGGGIAGASVAYWLAPHAQVIVLERESQPGYHSTGRSAALFLESYGPEQVRALTRASRLFFESPPAGFNAHPLLARRGELLVATAGQEAQLEQHWEIVRALSPAACRMNRPESCSMVPVLRPELVIGSVYDPQACDMDVHAIHQGFLRAMRASGGKLYCNAGVERIERAAGEWLVDAQGQAFAAPVLINAAGAWADAVARLAGVAPLGLQPLRRSAFMFAPPAGVASAPWPAVVGAADDWYFKPEAGLLLGSPANADPVEPQDVQADELDIALAIDRIESVTTLVIHRPVRTWAGLRSFVRDGRLVGGFDRAADGFFWVAAQGGYGIQTSAAMGEACAALARGAPLPDHLVDHGIDAAMLSPGRLGSA